MTEKHGADLRRIDCSAALTRWGCGVGLLMARACPVSAAGSFRSLRFSSVLLPRREKRPPLVRYRDRLAVGRDGDVDDRRVAHHVAPLIPHFLPHNEAGVADREHSGPDARSSPGKVCAW